MANLRPLAAELRAISSCVLGLELELIQAVVEELQLQRAALSQMAIVIDGHDVEIARRNTMRDARMPRCQLRFVVRPLERSEERRVRKECDSTGRTRWSPSH